VEQVKETCDSRLNANPCHEHGTGLDFFPDSARKLTTRFVAITPLSDSWDAQANRSCNRLSESLLPKTIATVQRKPRGHCRETSLSRTT
jgi:hypothetical protein